MTDIIFKVVVPVCTVLLSGALAFFTARSQARLQVRRQHRLEYLLKAYRDLSDSAHREGGLGERASAFEAAMSDIFLLGSPEQIKAADEVRQQLGTQGGASLDELLVGLRRELRQELGLTEYEPGGIPLIRMIPRSRSPKNPIRRR